MNNDRLKERMLKQAEESKNRDKEMILNPLSEYSTTELKKELRRRKRGWD